MKQSWYSTLKVAFFPFDPSFPNCCVKIPKNGALGTRWGRVPLLTAAMLKTPQQFTSDLWLPELSSVPSASPWKCFLLCQARIYCVPCSRGVVLTCHFDFYLHVCKGKGHTEVCACMYRCTCGPFFFKHIHHMRVFLKSVSKKTTLWYIWREPLFEYKCF